VFQEARAEGNICERVRELAEIIKTNTIKKNNNNNNNKKLEKTKPVLLNHLLNSFLVSIGG
jgi:hypothetical protein